MTLAPFLLALLGPQNAVPPPTCVLDNGPSDNRIDVVILGDGYTKKDQRAFDKLAEDVPDILAREEPLKEYASYFNFHKVNLISAEEGVDGFGRTYDTALDARTMDTTEGHVTVDIERVREIVQGVERADDLALVYVPKGILGVHYPGITVIGARDPSVTFTGWAGSFASLASESSISSSLRGQGEFKPAPNIADVNDPKSVPWAHWLDAGVRGVGVYQGADGHLKGRFKPTAGKCLLDNDENFCVVCREAFILEIYRRVDPIDGCVPEAFGRGSDALEAAEPMEFQVTVMQPESHLLEVRWWLLPEDDVSPRAAPGEGEPRATGPLPPIQAKPFKESKKGKKGVHKLKVDPRKLEPGRYWLVVRAEDTTKLRKEKFPWVLRDDEGLLQSERAWLIEVAGDS